jgi:fumarylacetoacetase
MSNAIDETHDPKRASWIASAQGHAEFPIQNLPLGVFSVDGDAPRGGIAIGESIFDLKAALAAGLFAGEAEQAAMAAAGAVLNPLLALGGGPRRALRRRVSALLAADGADRTKLEKLAKTLLHEAARCTVQLPAKVGAFTDFFAGIHHATNAGLRRNANPPLTPNYKYVPVAYHSRASSVRASGAPVRRPHGQRELGDAVEPVFGPSLKLDFELELGTWIASGNALGEPIPIGRADEHVAGLCLLNDWSARDIQRWESAPLGPFLAKNFCTTVSPWIVTAEALAPFRIAQPPRPAGDPRPLPYLWDDADQKCGAFDIELEAWLSTAAARAKKLPPQRLAQSNTKHLYWTVAQMVAHHTSSGCNLEAGDLFGSGTISAPDPSGYGSFAELSFDGKRPLALACGESRAFLEDGDELILRAHARREGRVAIGFGECRGTIMGIS